MLKLSRDELKEKVLSLPYSPGVYLMKDQTGTVIYVGKAKKLKNRVSQYFQESAAHTAKTRLMVSNIADFDYIIAANEFEALVLECSLIKRYQPHYNILLKDDKGYPYIRVKLSDPYPVFSMSAKRMQDGARYFGPYGGRAVTQQSINIIRQALKLPDCSRVFPRDIGKERPCLSYQIGNCDGWCRSCMRQEDYLSRVRQAVLMLEGKNAILIRSLQADMEEAAEALEFEKAAQLRDRMKAIESLSNRQLVCSGAMADTDVIGVHQGLARTGFAVLHFVGGNLIDKDIELTDTEIGESREEAVSAFVKQYYLRRETAPKTICLPCEIEDAELFSQYLQQSFGIKPRFHVPARGDQRHLIELACSNALEEAERVSTEYERTNKTLELLAEMLQLEAPPKRMESYDISNLGDQDIVASMVVFSDGKPLKRDYKRFKLKEMTAQDDYGSMRQVIERRFAHYLEGDSGFDVRPDLLLIDGGQVHAETVRRQITAMGLSIPIFGMVKDDRHRTRALITPDGLEIGIQTNQSVFALIGTIQEETHRFAITYQRNLRSKRTRYSELDKIPGVGDKRKQQLLKSFHSLKAIREATPEELAAVVPRSAAEAVYRHFHGVGIQHEEENT